MKKYVYYATGENVESIKFNDNVKAWEFVENNSNYDCVVEMMEEVK